MTNKSGDDSFEKWFNDLENAEAFFNNEIAAVEKSDGDIFSYETLTRHSDNYKKMTYRDAKEICCDLIILKVEYLEEDIQPKIIEIKNSDTFFFRDENDYYKNFYTK